jgi:hypothetical protein
LSASANVLAQGTLAYSFEDDVLPDPLHGFTANGAPLIQPLTRDAIGATEGTKSLKIELLQGATYVGALTADLFPTINTDPVALHSVSFDLTIPTQFPLEGFVDIFVVFFGIDQAGFPAEVSFQSDLTNRVGIGDFAPGTYPITMEFNEAFHPLDFENFDPRPFGDIFGTQGSGPIDIIATSFQLTINKSTQAPWVGYVDNVRFSSQPPVGTPGDFDGDGDVDGRDFLVWQRGGTTPALDPALLAQWQTNYGIGGLTAGFAAVPEPTCGLLAILAATIGFTCGRKR